MKTIKDILNIEVEKSGKKFRADAKILSGTPPVGIGKTEYEALYDLLAKLMFMIGCRSSYGHRCQWQERIIKFWEDKEYNDDMKN